MWFQIRHLYWILTRPSFAVHIERTLNIMDSWSLRRPPAHCVQYFTGVAGVIHSYGHNQADQTQSTLLQNQHYENCIRRERGEHGILYRVHVPFWAWEMVLHVITRGILSSYWLAQGLINFSARALCFRHANCTLGRGIADIRNTLSSD